MQSTFFSLLLYFIVFFTGAAGLIFQVTWQKYVSRLLGSDSIATAIILGSFLGGLSLGYYLCGKFSTRITNHFKAYAILEGLIGLWCISFPTIFRAVESLTHSWSFASPLLILIQGVLCSALLMGIPTICMGGTIPFLTRGISRNIVEATNIHANVYAINTAGAFLGTLIAGFYLIPTHGLPVTIMSTSFVNLGACLLVYLLSGVMPPRDLAEITVEVHRATISESAAVLSRFPSWMLYSIVFLSGFYVMTLENVLIRITNFSVGSSSYSFSLIVAVFILAIAIGSSVVGRFHQIPRHVLFVNQVFITLALLGIYSSLDTWPYWAHLIRIAFQSNIVGFWGYYSGVSLALMAVLLLPVALMGATIPLAFHELKRDLQHVGTHSGMLFSWNTLGNLSGSLIGGIVFYYFLNNARVFLAATLLAAFSACLAGWYVSRKSTLVAGSLIALVFLFIVFIPFYNQQHFMAGTFFARTPLSYSLSNPEHFFQQLAVNSSLKFYKDGPTCSVAVLESSKVPGFDEIPMSIMINGKSDSSTVGDSYTIKLLAHIPALLAKSRKEILVIGLGTGGTAGELVLYPNVEHIDIAEISPAVIEALPVFQAFTHGLQEDPRARIHLGDAFRILGRSNKKWNIIISEPSNPWVTGVDLLFTQEFYQLAKEHLTENGILVQWTHLYAASPVMLGMIVNTLQQEFAYCRGFMSNLGDMVIIATNEPLSPENLWKAEETLRFNNQVKTSLDAINMGSLDSILLRELWSPSYIADHFSGYGIQTMDNPRLHYIAGKDYFIGENVPSKLLFSSASTPYRHEYLMVKKYANWEDFTFSKEPFELLLLSTRDKVEGSLLPMNHALMLKAYLSNSDVFPLSEKQKKMFNVDLIPFIMESSQEENDWSVIGLEKASFREKARPLLQHVQTFRNWIVPYPVDGLQTLLQEGILKGKDEYEKNWCTLQLALLLVKERHDKDAINAVVNQIIRRDDGTIILREQDKFLLGELERVMNNRGEYLEGT